MERIERGKTAAPNLLPTIVARMPAAMIEKAPPSPLVRRHQKKGGEAVCDAVVGAGPLERVARRRQGTKGGR